MTMTRGRNLQREAHGLGPVAGFGDDGNGGVVFQHAAKTAAHQGVVVDKQHGDFSWHEVVVAPAEF